MSNRVMYKARYDNGHGKFWCLFPAFPMQVIRIANNRALQRGWELLELQHATKKGVQR